jgi:hypothetical protein
MIATRLLLAFAIVATAISCKKPQPAPMAKTPFVEPDPEEVTGSAPKFRPRIQEVPTWTETMAVTDVKVEMILPEELKGQDYKTPLTESVEAAFLSTGRFEIMERARLNAPKDEILTSNDSAFFDPAFAVRQGKFLGAKVLVLPTARIEAGVFGTRITLQVKVMDTTTASTVQMFRMQTMSHSLSINSSISSCLQNIQDRLMEEIAATYPPRGTIVKLEKDRAWVEAKQTKAFRPGSRIRVLRYDPVQNTLTQTQGMFLTQVATGKVLAVESTGLIVRIYEPKKVEGGCIIEMVL